MPWRGALGRPAAYMEGENGSWRVLEAWRAIPYHRRRVIGRRAAEWFNRPGMAVDESQSSSATTMNPILKKLRFKEQNPVLLLDAPREFETIAAELPSRVDRKPKGVYELALAFVKSLAEAERAAGVVKTSLADSGIFWLCYPKGTSKNYRGVDVNRDIAWQALAKLGLEGVAIVAIDDDWSAMRFKHADPA